MHDQAVERALAPEIEDEYRYVGTELEVFHYAKNWKNYYRRQMREFIGDEVLEVGAGIGGTCVVLCEPGKKRWLCIEPDTSQARTIREKIGDGRLPDCCEVMPLQTADVPDGETFDTIIYIDVLEHIEDDAEEIGFAFKHLRPGGHLIVLSPAHQFLYSPFDAAVAHFRRYNKKSLEAAVSNYDLKCVKMVYLDSVGCLISLGNKMVLRSTTPTWKQMRFWDRGIVPISAFIDRFFGYKLGKSILGVWRRES
ncbi:MAG: class I SAM-dependent methyltransferase [Pyrinomonadaceae bacterium]